jgi:hypothetical protein
MTEQRPLVPEDLDENQLCFSRRFVCLFARSGLRVSNAARNDLAAVLEDFPIPVPFVVAGHNAEFNAVCHVAVGGFAFGLK